MRPGLRKFALTTHITLSVGWIGAVLAYLVLVVAAMTRQDAQTLRAACELVDLRDAAGDVIHCLLRTDYR